MSSNSSMYMSRSQLEVLLEGRTDALEINKIVSAYEMSEMIYSEIEANDASPFFYHLTRVAQIILAELSIFDSEIIIAALLHDFNEIKDKISRDIVEFNFGAYTAFLIESLSVQIEEIESLPKEFTFENSETIKLPFDDYLIIKIAEITDSLRLMDFDLIHNPITRYCDFTGRLLPIAEKSTNESVRYLLEEIYHLKNKILG